jgi:hypothetical protein
MTPTVSVIIPMHNAEATIGEALESLRAQSCTDWEGVVVDDASTDASVEAAASIARREPRLRVIANRRARGPAGARNTGIEASSGRFLGFLDADDWLPARALGDLVAAALARPGACAFGGLEHRGPAGEDLGWRVPAAARTLGLDDLLDRERLTIMTLTPRATLGDDRFDESLSICEDMDLWLRLAARGVAFTPCPAVTYIYRLRPSSLTRRYSSMREQQERVLRSAFERLGDADDADARLDAALQREALLLATMAAFEDGPDAGARVFEPGWRAAAIDPMQAVDLALWGAPYAACRSRHDWADLPDGWPEALGAWWSRCESAGWAPPGFTDACAALVAERLVSNERVAERVIESLVGARRVALLGFGANARLLAEHLLARGVAVEARDDRIDAGAISDLPEGVEAASMDAPLPAGVRAVVTTLEDDWLLRRIGGRAERAVRWSLVRRAMLDRVGPAAIERIHRHAHCPVG